MVRPELGPEWVNPAFKRLALSTVSSFVMGITLEMEISFLVRPTEVIPISLAICCALSSPSIAPKPSITSFICPVTL
ncbi:hypothetical protein HZ326_13285 [Fusarium oxysporum f. sp. albedinis]|nr:hypothetical protein HZ326_13285 [Fusarium oxysporum f. sp. albedinis]